MGAVALVAVCILGCDREVVDASEVGPYAVAEVQVINDVERPGWAPGDDQMSTWFGEALGLSEKGLSAGPEGMAMRATLHHRVELRELPRGARLTVYVDLQAERSVISDEEPMVTLLARAERRHILARGMPSEEVLQGLSYALGRQAVDDAVLQLRLRAQIRQMEPAGLVAWVGDEELPDAVRRYAIRRAALHQPPGLEEALIEVAYQAPNQVAASAARALHAMESERATHLLMDVAQRASRDEEYDLYLGLLPLLADLDEGWVNIYLQTVARAHSVARVRVEAQAAIGGR